MQSAVAALPPSRVRIFGAEAVLLFSRAHLSPMFRYVSPISRRSDAGPVKVHRARLFSRAGRESRPHKKGGAATGLVVARQEQEPILFRRASDYPLTLRPVDARPS